MKRLCALSMVVIVLCGCKGQSPPGTDPFFGRTTVPPPPTGAAIGGADPYYRGSPSAAPPMVMLPAPQASAPTPNGSLPGPFAPPAATVTHPPVTQMPATQPPVVQPPTSYLPPGAPPAGSMAPPVQPAAPAGSPPASFAPPSAPAQPPMGSAAPPASAPPATGPASGNRYDPPGGSFDYRGSSNTAPTNPVSLRSGNSPPSLPAEQVPARLADTSASRIRIVEPQNRPAPLADAAASGGATRNALTPASTTAPTNATASASSDAASVSLAGRQPVIQTLQPRPNASVTAPAYAAPTYGTPRTAAGSAGSSLRPQPTPGRSVDLMDLPQAATSNGPGTSSASSSGEPPASADGVRLVSGASEGAGGDGKAASGLIAIPSTEANPPDASAKPVIVSGVAPLMK
jgi:hypothetical protein